MAIRILIVDDDLDFQAAIRVILETAEYECIQAFSMREGLKLVSEERPDLIILDIMMEDISAGFRFAKERMEIEDTNAEAHIPILFVSSLQKFTNLNFRDRMRPFLFSADGFLDKPTDPMNLLEKIQEMTVEPHEFSQI